MSYSSSDDESLPQAHFESGDLSDSSIEDTKPVEPEIIKKVE